MLEIVCGNFCAAGDATVGAKTFYYGDMLRFGVKRQVPPKQKVNIITLLRRPQEAKVRLQPLPEQRRQRRDGHLRKQGRV